MQYVTGIPAFGIPCELDSVGRWNILKEDYVDEERFTIKESDDMPLKDYGIEKNKLVPYREFCTYNVANHVRAYVDLLYMERFDILPGLFAECINNSKCRKDIFMLVYGKLRNLAQFKEINEFMCNEFGNAWMSYVQAVMAMAEHLASQPEVPDISKIATQNNPTYVNFTKQVMEHIKTESEEKV